MRPGMSLKHICYCHPPQAQAEEAARAAGEEVAAAARRASSLEGLLRAKCKEVDKLRRQVNLVLAGIGVISYTALMMGRQGGCDFAAG